MHGNALAQFLDSALFGDAEAALRLLDDLRFGLGWFQ